MKKAFPEALVTGHEPLIPGMPNAPGDRHVAAAAMKAGAQVIVTSNLRHMPTRTYRHRARERALDRGGFPQVSAGFASRDPAY